MTKIFDGKSTRNTNANNCYKTLAKPILILSPILPNLTSLLSSTEQLLTEFTTVILGANCHHISVIQPPQMELATSLIQLSDMNNQMAVIMRIRKQVTTILQKKHTKL